MWSERLKRLGIILGVTCITTTIGLLSKKAIETYGINGLIDKAKETSIGKRVGLVGTNVLGEAFKKIPNLEKEESPATSAPASNPTEEVSGASIQIQPEKIIQTETQRIVEILKELPKDELERIKKQVFREFCLEILKEE